MNHPTRTHARRSFLLALATFCAFSVAAAADDTAQIVRTLKAQFETPQRPLAVNPVSVEGTFAIAGWSQGGSGGRALLQRMSGSWQIVLCAGDSLLQPAAAGTVVMSQAWARATPVGITVAAAYLTMENRGRQADTLLSISSPIADSAGLHQTTTVNGMANMRMAGAVVLAPGQTLKAEPRGLHVMLTGVKKPLVKGTQVPLVLTFRNAGAITVQVDILATDATAYENHAGH